MSKIRVYHVKALLWTYLVWAVLNLSCAYSLCENFPYRHRLPFTRVLYFWKALHTLPLWDWWYDARGFPWVLVVIVGSCVAGGVLTKGRAGRFLVIAGMSLWFLTAHLFLGGSA